MPNVKIYVDTRHFAGLEEGLAAALPPLRAALCRMLDVPVAACQLALVAVRGLPDQPQVNAELFLMPRADRTPQMLHDVAQEVRSHLSAASGLHVAVRLHALDPATYIALK